MTPPSTKYLRRKCGMSFPCGRPPKHTVKARCGRKELPPSGDPKKDRRRAYCRERMRKIRAGEWQPMSRTEVGKCAQ